MGKFRVVLSVVFLVLVVAACATEEKYEYDRIGMLLLLDEIAQSDSQAK